MGVLIKSQKSYKKILNDKIQNSYFAVIYA